MVAVQSTYTDARWCQGDGTGVRVQQFGRFVSNSAIGAGTPRVQSRGSDRTQEASTHAPQHHHLHALIMLVLVIGKCANMEGSVR